ncbi:peptidoglycan DD-metalloendopeptidase family protein [Chloroflexota bacterium]
MPVAAQGPCGTVDSISPPLDPAEFRLAYPFGRPSSRFDGRYHAGDDWVKGRTTTYGAPVQAIAKGRITYSAPWGWGRDKGIVIIEHILPDGTWWYSLYGHMEEVNGHNFPPIHTCVDEGDIIGAIGRPRPAPHLHFEIRNFSPDAPGPGYWSTNPIYSGWRNPAKFIANWQGWLHPAYRWHAELTEESGPQEPAIMREDGAAIVFDDGRLKALTNGGQILWRYILPEDLDIVRVLPYQGQILVVDRTGIMQLWRIAGGFLETWQLPESAIDTAHVWEDMIVIHTAADELVAYGPDRAERWRVADIPQPLDLQNTRQMLAVMSSRQRLTFLGLDGRVYSTATLRGTGDLAPAPGGGFYVRTQTALWHVDNTGAWHRLAEAPTAQPHRSTLTSLPDGRFFLTDGQRDQTLYAYDSGGQQLWATPLPTLKSKAFMLVPEPDGPLLLADGWGQIILVDPQTGTVCHEMSVWGSRRGNAWAGLGPDNILRLHISDQLLGLDWETLRASCP